MGTYRDGKVLLHEAPPGVGHSARVLVTFRRVDDAEAAEQAEARRCAGIAHMEQGLDLGGGSAREEARLRLLSRLAVGWDLGGGPYASREELYEDRLR